MSASTMNNTTITNALLFKAAARISEENPQVEMNQALAMAQEMAKTPLFNKLFDCNIGKLIACTNECQIDNVNIYT